MSQDIDQNAPEAPVSMSRQSVVTQDTSVNAENYSDPFSDSSSAAFFGGADRRMLLDEVIHLCQFGNNLVAALGDEGVGKTTFLSQARYELAETAFCCFISGSVMTSAEDIFKQIISQLELPVAASSSAGEMIATLRHSMAEGNLHRVVIIIDDAHHLNDQILSALVSLLQGHQGQHLHILVGGDKSLAQRLDQFEMVDVLVYDITLNPLSVDDVRDYLDFKLSTSGYQDSSQLSDGQVSTMWSETGGYPAAVNRSAQNLLFQQDFGGDQEERPTGLPIMHMSLLVVLLAALIMALFYMGGGDEPVVEAQPEVTVLPQEPAPPESQISTETLANDSPVVPAQVVESPKPEESVNTVEPIATEAVSQQLPSPVLAEAPPVKPITEKVPLAQASEPEPEVINPKAPLVASDDVDKAKQSLQEELKKEAELLKAKEGESQQKSAEVAAAPKSSVVKAPQGLTSDEQQVLGWPDNEYTLQVMAAAQEKGLRDFIAKQPNKEALRLVTVERNNQPWYVVLVGVYDDGNLARQTIQSLPQSQVNAGPWPRKVSDIKQQIRAFKGR
ncbi:MAG: AAA family ATPase [Cellvibrionaceae bacterium]